MLSTKKNKLNKNSLKNNLVIASTLIIFITVPAFALITYFSSVNVIKLQVSQISKQILQQLNLFISSELMDQERMAINITENSDVQNILLNYDNYSYFKQQELTSKVENVLNEAILLKKIKNIYIFNMNKNLVLSSDPYSQYLDFKNNYNNIFTYAIENEGKFKWIEAAEGVSVSIPDSQQLKYLTLTKTIKSKINNQTLGYVIITFKDDFLSSCYKKEYDNKLDILIVSDNSNLVSEYNTNNESYKKILEIVNKSNYNSIDNSEVYKIETDKLQIFVTKIQTTDWKIILNIKFYDQLKDIRKTRNILITISFLLVLIFILFNFKGISYILNPFYYLTRKYLSGNVNTNLKTKELSVKNIHNKVKLKYMLTSNFSIMIVIPIIILIIFELIMFTKIIYSKISDSYYFYIEQSARQANSKFKRIENSLNNLYINPEIISAMVNSEYQSYYQYDLLLKETAQILKEEQNKNQEISYINIFDKNFKLIYSTSSSQQDIPSELYNEYIKRLDGETVYYGPYSDIFNREVISIGKRIRLPMSLITIGFICINIEKESLKDFIYDLNDVQVYVYSSDGKEVISYFNQRGITSDESNFKKNTKINNKNNVIEVSNVLDINKWKISIIIMEKSIKLMVWKSLFNNLYILIIYLILLAFIIYMLVRRFYTPINILNQCVRNIKSRITFKNQSEIQSNGKNEIGMLSEVLEYMESEIKKLVDENYRTEMIKRETELYALQVQINPHFLFNTLETIRWKSIELQKGNNDVSEMIYQLSEFFRMSLKNKEGIITILEEFNYAKTYSNILTFRFDDKLDIYFNVDDGIMSCRTIKMVLQPLIENSIVHGFQNKDGKWIVIVTIKKIENKIIYSVKDNGIGIEEGKLNEIKEGTYTNTGIGLKNINDRIKITYGNDYGIGIDSSLGIGTTITVFIPFESN